MATIVHCLAACSSLQDMLVCVASDNYVVKLTGALRSVGMLGEVSPFFLHPYTRYTKYYKLTEFC